MIHNMNLKFDNHDQNCNIRIFIYVSTAVIQPRLRLHKPILHNINNNNNTRLTY
jgi:hypothetical protein